MVYNNRKNLTILAKYSLISRILGGKLRMDNQFVLEYQDEIYTFVYMLLRDENRASLIVQQCFSKLSRQYLSGDNKTLRKYLFSLSVTAVRELSAREIRSNMKQHKSMNCSRIDLGQSWIAFQINFLLLDQGLVISLIDVIGMNYEEAAEILEQPLNWVAQTLAYARYTLSTGNSVLQ
jgi:DNA-directed RNA polymerase specialized sigma24 family protein